MGTALYEDAIWNKEEDGFGLRGDTLGITPRTAIIQKMERVLTGLDESQLMASMTTPEKELEAGSVERMPSNIRAMMLLAEAYDLLEGDVHEIMNVPIDVGLTDITIDCTDSVVKNIYIDMFDAVNMQEMVEYNWLYCNMYGQGFPLEVWDGDVPQAIMHLDPKTIHIGNPLGFGARSFQLEDGVLKKNLDMQLKVQVEQALDPMLVFQSFGKKWNEFEILGNNIPLNPENITHLHVGKLPHNRYAVPPIARAYRTITTRQRLEEMILATIEGIKNQLWLFTKEKFQRGEAKALNEVLANTRGDHLGYLVWPGLDVKQFVPGSIDTLLGNEKWMGLTQHIFRQLGISLYVVSGELPGGTGSNPEIDVRLLMLKVEADRRRQLKWLGRFAKKFADKNDISAKVTIGFRLNTFDQEDLIKNTLAPLATFGQISSHTFLKEVGYTYEQELEYKKEEMPNKMLFQPMSSFSQVSTDKSGATKTTESQGQRGRTPDAQNPDQMMKASIEDYQVAISRSFQDVKKAESDEDKRKAIAAFIAALLMANTMFMRRAYSQGYLAVGGAKEVSLDRMDAVVLWNNEYAENFRKDLLEAVGTDKDFAEFESRAMLYPSEGWKKAYLAAVWQAKREQDITGWRRILRPDLSVAGPCPACVEDSKIIHAISEEWFDHVGGVCSIQYIGFYRGTSSTMPMRVPSLEYPVPVVRNM